MMVLKQTLKLVAAGGVAVLAMVGQSGAQAQNWDGDHQVRAGFYLQSGRMGYDVNDGINRQALSHNSFGVGATGGLEWLRAGSLRLGTEIDISATTGHDTHSVAAVVVPLPGTGTPAYALKFGAQYFASIRGRLGVQVRPDLMIYGTAGFGALGTEIDGIGSGLAKIAHTNTGGVFGGGLEYQRGGTIFFLEYLHGSFGTKSSTFIVGAQPLVLGAAPTGGTPVTYRYDADLNLVRLGVKFKLGHDWRDEVRGDRGRDPLK